MPGKKRGVKAEQKRFSTQRVNGQVLVEGSVMYTGLWGSWCWLLLEERGTAAVPRHLEIHYCGSTSPQAFPKVVPVESNDPPVKPTVQIYVWRGPLRASPGRVMVGRGWVEGLTTS